jgi:large subunit ribosomal protein L6
MSRVGTYAINIPQGVSVTQDGQTVTAEGPKGTLHTQVGESFDIHLSDQEIRVQPRAEQISQEMKAYWGLYRSLVANIVEGVSEGYSKKLQVEGVGYRAQLEGDNTLSLHLGYSHEVRVEAPEGIDFAVEKNEITVSGIDKQAVGQVAADIRSKRPPEPYKGKGIRYADEKVQIKEGKTAS